MYSLDGRLSLQSLSEYETSRNWITETVFSPTPPPTQPPPVATSSQDNGDSNPRYMGISLPRRLNAIFPEATPSDMLLDKTNKARANYESRRILVKILFIRIILFNHYLNKFIKQIIITSRQNSVIIFQIHINICVSL